MDYFASNTSGSRHVNQSQGASTYDMDFYATSYSLAHIIPDYKPSPPLIRDGTGFIRSLVPTGDIGVMAGPEVRSLTGQLCQSALPERHPAWVVPDGREPLPATVTSGIASGYVSNATPTHQIVKCPRGWRESPGRPPCYLRDQSPAWEHLVKNPPTEGVSEYHAIYKQKAFHADLAGTGSGSGSPGPESPELICSTGFTHERAAEGGPQARHFITPPTSYQSQFQALQLKPAPRLPSTNNDTRDVGTGYPHHRAVPVAGELRPPQTKCQVDFGCPVDKKTTDILLPTKISSSGFNSNNPVKLLQLDDRTFCTDYKDGFADPTPDGAASRSHTMGNITARTQTFYPLASFRHRYRPPGDAADLTGQQQQAYPLRSWAARSAPGGIGTERHDGPLEETVR